MAASHDRAHAFGNFADGLDLAFGVELDGVGRCRSARNLKIMEPWRQSGSRKEAENGPG